MNTIEYSLETGDITAFVSGTNATPQAGHGVLYTPKDISELLDHVVLDGALVPRMSLEYVLSDIAPDLIKAPFWRSYRTKLLSESDYMLLPDVGDSVFRERALEYRKQLRDLPKHEKWPRLALADLPEKPNPNAVQLTIL